jgi:hypothetical protein
MVDLLRQFAWLDGSFAIGSGECPGPFSLTGRFWAG